jgi:acyl-CoA thioester hydrolase
MKKITFDLDIYSYQIDSLGQVNNAVYNTWMEIGRFKLLDAMGLPLSTLISQGSLPSLANTTICYKTPLFLADRVWVEMWISALGYALTFTIQPLIPKTLKIEYWQPKATNAPCL